jgi:hypothetical protein
LLLGGVGAESFIGAVGMFDSRIKHNAVRSKADETRR